MSASLGSRTPAWVGQLARFAVVGVLNTLVYYGVYLACLQAFPLLLSHVVGWWAAVTGSYLMNTRFTYRVPPSWRSYLMYPLTSLTTLVVSAAVLVVLVDVFEMSAVWAPLVAGLCAVPATFLVARAIIVRPGRQALD